MLALGAAWEWGLHQGTWHPAIPGAMSRAITDGRGENFGLQATLIRTRDPTLRGVSEAAYVAFAHGRHHQNKEREHNVNRFCQESSMKSKSRFSEAQKTTTFAGYGRHK